MKIELVFTRKDGKMVRIPFTRREIGDIYDTLWIADPRDLKLNRIKLNMNKMMFAIHDVRDEGRTYTYQKMKNGKEHRKKEIHYLVKKPVWK